MRTRMRFHVVSDIEEPSMPFCVGEKCVLIKTESMQSRAHLVECEEGAQSSPEKPVVPLNSTIRSKI